MTGDLIDLLVAATEEKPKATRTKCCARCAHWGVQADLRESARWKFCTENPPALANADYLCGHYVRRAKP